MDELDPVNRVDYTRSAIEKIFKVLSVSFPMPVGFGLQGSCSVLGVYFKNEPRTLDISTGDTTGGLEYGMTPFSDDPQKFVEATCGWLKNEGYIFSVGQGYVLTRKGLDHCKVDLMIDSKSK